MKIQSVWGITVDWQAYGSQAVICTPVIWRMVITTVCVCVQRSVCLLLWTDEWQFKQTQWSIKHKKEFSFDHIFTSTASIYRWNTSKSELFFFYNYTFILSSDWVTSFPFQSFHPYIHRFIPSFSLHPCRWGRKTAAMLQWSWEAENLGLCPTSD